MKRAAMFSKKWLILVLLAAAELLAMGVWFSASAVVAPLRSAWELDAAGAAWLTMSVQVGFVVGAVASAVYNLADRIPAARLMALTALLAAACTALIPVVNAFPQALVLRFLTGLFLAGVYPVGMKIVATWTREDRGLGIGLLIGALTLGSASPHLLNALGGIQDWESVLFLSAALAALGAVLVLLFVVEGPFQSTSPPFNAHYIIEVIRQPDLLLANLGYLGHMWELFAMWTWITVFYTASFDVAGISSVWASLAGFSVIAAGGPGSLVAGKIADRAGRTTVTIGSLIVSGLCALLIGRFFGGNPWLLLGIGLLWGFAIVADSAQFSAAISELCQREYIGTALTVQTSMGFLLTLVTIRLIPTLEAALGWNWAFTFLAFGPLVGILAMYRLRKSVRAQEAAHMLHRENM